MHSLWSAAVQYTNYGTGGAFELPTRSGTYITYTMATQDLPDIYARALGPQIPHGHGITINYLPTTS